MRFGTLVLSFFVFAVPLSAAYANPAAKPAFPTTLGKAKKNLDQIAWILKDPGKGYCQEAQKLDELLGKLTRADERATIEGEQRFSKVVCKDGKYVGLSEPGMDKNTFVVANVQI